MINQAYEFFMNTFFSGETPAAISAVAEELASLFAIGSVLFVVGTVVSLFAFFFRFITGLSLRSGK